MCALNWPVHSCTVIVLLSIVVAGSFVDEIHRVIINASIALCIWLLMRSFHDQCLTSRRLYSLHNYNYLRMISLFWSVNKIILIGAEGFFYHEIIFHSWILLSWMQILNDRTRVALNQVIKTYIHTSWSIFVSKIECYQRFYLSFINWMK